MFDMVPDDGSDSNFDDVQEGMYYYEPIGIAKKLGIVRVSEQTSLTHQGKLQGKT